MKIRIFLIFFTIFTVVSANYGASAIHGTALQSAIISGNDVDLRADPGPYGKIITSLPKGTAVEILDQSGRWYKVKLPDGRIGWIYRQFIEVKSLAANSSGARTGSFPADQLLEYAKSFLEVTYIYGGDSPRGFDCSGYTQYIFSKFGIRLPHRADLQRENGSEVRAMADLQPCDLVFFRTEGSEVVNHVGIYLGGNQFIHASSGYGAVRISPLNYGYYFKCYAGGRRLGNFNTDNLPDELERM